MSQRHRPRQEQDSHRHRGCRRLWPRWVSFSCVGRTGAAGEAGGVKRVAVLPFENLGAPEDDYFADGIADEIRGKLTSLPGLRSSPEAARRPTRRRRRRRKQIAEELEAGYLLTATVRWEKGGGGSRVHVSPELVEVSRPERRRRSGSSRSTRRSRMCFRCSRTSRRRWRRRWAARSARSEEKRLAEKPTQNLAAYDAFLKGEEIRNSGANDPASLRKEIGFYEQAVALDPGFAQAWAGVSSANSLLYASSTPTPALAERARQAGEKAVALAPNRPEGYLALGAYERLVSVDSPAPWSSTRRVYALPPAMPPSQGNGARRAGPRALGCGGGAFQSRRCASTPGPPAICRSLATRSSVCGAIPRRERPSTVVWLSRPPTIILIENKAMTYLGEGNLAGARAVLKAAPKEVEPTALVAYLATYQDLVWVLDEEQRELLLRLTPSAFDDDRGTWALCLVQAYALKGDAANVRTYAEEARKAIEEQLRAAPDDAQRHVDLGLALAYLGRKEEAIREGERGVALDPVSKDARNGPYFQHQLARIYMLVGEPEKALDQLEPLLKIPYYLSPGWLKIDPNFDPLRKNPRFQKLVAAGSAVDPAVRIPAAPMTLSAGTRLGPYEILAPLGAGGMGEVYRARTRGSSARSRSRSCRRRSRRTRTGSGASSRRRRRRAA